MAETNKKRRLDVLLLALAAIFMGATIGGFVYLQLTTAQNQAWLDQVKQLSTDLTGLSTVGRDATRGVNPDFVALEDLAQDFDDNLRGLTEGDAEYNVQALPGEMQDELAAVADSWKTMRKAVDAVVKGETAYENVAGATDELTETLTAMVDAGIRADKVGLLERMKVQSAQVLRQGRDAAGSAQQLKATADNFESGATQLPEAWESVRTAVDSIVTDAPGVAEMQQSAATLPGEAFIVIGNAKILEQAMTDYVARYAQLPLAVISAAVLAVLSLVGFIVLFLGSARREVREAAAKDARQQSAILDLLNDITTLADGDLTVHANVTSDFTGTIADSINFTIDAMRGLVGTINSTSAEVATASSQTADTARRMSSDTEQQAQEVARLTNTIVASSQQLQQVATRAEQLATEAQQSMRVAHNGAETVNRTIAGMSALREQIQDTSKRIKRLGESSQEIGNIIEFINDIAEQTNTLALNASIQAAMAGEQGRGFAVVADEVQRLAERAATATRQIEALVKAIQTDTGEAIVSMERSTQNVVVGAKSAEEAGAALTQVENSSLQLAKLIAEISNSARSQSVQTTGIAGTMQSIRDIAVQTSGSAAKTAEQIGNLTALSEKLRQTVAGFKLPTAS